MNRKNQEYRKRVGSYVLGTRVGSDMTLREAAKAFGITPYQMDSIEKGRALTLPGTPASDRDDPAPRSSRSHYRALVGMRILELREAAGFTIEHAADAFGLRAAQLVAMERGELVPQFDREIIGEPEDGSKETSTDAVSDAGPVDPTHGNCPACRSYMAVAPAAVATTCQNCFRTFRFVERRWVDYQAGGHEDSPKQAVMREALRVPDGSLPTPKVAYRDDAPTVVREASKVDVDNEGIGPRPETVMVSDGRVDVGPRSLIHVYDDDGHETVTIRGGGIVMVHLGAHVEMEIRP